MLNAVFYETSQHIVIFCSLGPTQEQVERKSWFERMLERNGRPDEKFSFEPNS